MDVNKLMAEAVKLSVKHKHTTKPNPVVGALLYANGKIVSTGAHEYFGGPHAEVNCIDKVDAEIKKEDLTLFCTLEPILQLQQMVSSLINPLLLNYQLKFL